MYWSHEYILFKNPNLRNYIVIGNEDAQELLANKTIGKVMPIKVAYGWFKVKNKSFALKTSTIKMLRLLENIRMPTRPNMVT